MLVELSVHLGYLESKPILEDSTADETMIQNRVEVSSIHEYSRLLLLNPVSIEGLRELKTFVSSVISWRSDNFLLKSFPIYSCVFIRSLGEIEKLESAETENWGHVKWMTFRNIFIFFFQIRWNFYAIFFQLTNGRRVNKFQNFSDCWWNEYRAQW